MFFTLLTTVAQSFSYHSLIKCLSQFLDGKSNLFFFLPLIHGYHKCLYDWPSISYMLTSDQSSSCGHPCLLHITLSSFVHLLDFMKPLCPSRFP